MSQPETWTCKDSANLSSGIVESCSVCSWYGTQWNDVFHEKSTICRKSCCSSRPTPTRLSSKLLKRTFRLLGILNIVRITRLECHPSPHCKPKLLWVRAPEIATSLVPPLPVFMYRGLAFDASTAPPLQLVLHTLKLTDRERERKEGRREREWRERERERERVEGESVASVS